MLRSRLQALPEHCSGYTPHLQVARALRHQTSSTVGGCGATSVPSSYMGVLHSNRSLTRLNWAGAGREQSES